MEYTFDFRDKVNNVNCVYKIKNIINEKVYIGSTYNLKKRIIDHYNLLSTNKHHSIKLQRSWNKYGSKNFRFLILEENIDSKMILEREQFYIDLSQSSKLGYNVLPIAGTSFGCKWSTEAKEKYSNLKKSLKIGQGVIQFNFKGKIIGEYPTIRSASEAIGFKSSSNIGECCRGKKKSIGGFIWEFSNKSKQSKYGFHDFTTVREIVLCPYCKTDDTRRAGFSKWGENSKQMYRCIKCKKKFNKDRCEISNEVGITVGIVDRILRKHKEG